MMYGRIICEACSMDWGICSADALQSYRKIHRHCNGGESVSFILLWDEEDEED